MKNYSLSLEQIRKQGLLPLFYQDEIKTCLQLTATLYSAGIRVIEFTARGSKALDNFRLMVKERDAQMRDMLLGVGTIRSSEQATSFIEAGADFLVSPVFDKRISDLTHAENILWIPGCMTPTEIHVAENSGCEFVKLFPGNVLGPAFVEGLRPLFPSVKFIVTGGVDTSVSNLQQWFAAGVAGVGIGSKLIPNQLSRQQDFDLLEDRAREVLAIIAEIRSTKQ